MKKLLLAAAASLLLCGSAFAQADNNYGGPSNSVPFSFTTATTTQLFAGNSVRSSDITQLTFSVSAVDTVTLEYGTGSNCGTGTTVLIGPMSVAAGEPIIIGDGFGSLAIVPAGNNVCLVSGTAVTIGGSISWNIQIGSL